jgi:hypothetical protein
MFWEQYTSLSLFFYDKFIGKIDCIGQFPVWHIFICSSHRESGLQIDVQELVSKRHVAFEKKMEGTVLTNSTYLQYIDIVGSAALLT